MSLIYHLQFKGIKGCVVHCVHKHLTIFISSSRDNIDLKGKRAIVTGAAQGFGAAIALRLAEAGAKVIIADRNENGAKQKAADLSSLGYDVSPMQVDIYDAPAVTDLVQSVVSENGGIDVLVNNAGIFSNYYFENMSLEEFQTTLNVNVVGTFNCTQAVVRAMKKNKNKIRGIKVWYGRK